MNSEPNPSEDIASLRRDVEAWGRSIRGFLLVMIAVLLFYVSRLLLLAPKFESIFTDMLGSFDKMPVASRFVIESPLVILGVLWLVAAVATLFILRTRRPHLVGVTAISTMLFLIASTHLITTSLLAPMVEILKALSGGVP
jgi:hypothetical protein